MGRSFGELVETRAAGEHTATVIILHGLGDTGHGWEAAASQLRVGPHIKFLFPTAPTRPITMSMGMPMTGWFDLDTLENYQKMLQGQLDHEGIKESVEYIRTLIDKEVAAGIQPSRIVVAGFSQGGHVALKTVLQSTVKLAGCIAMSTWLEPFTFEVPTAKDVPFLICHGTADPLVPEVLGQSSKKLLESQGFNITYNSYQGMAHSCCAQELNDLSQFLSAVLPASTAPMPTREAVESMSVKELKAFLAGQGVSTRGMLEKSDFVEKAKSLCSE